MLNITERQAGDTTVLDLEGNIIMGGGSTHLRETIRRLIEEDKKKLILNFAHVKYLDSSGVGELVSGSVALGARRRPVKAHESARQGRTGHGAQQPSLHL